MAKSTKRKLSEFENLAIKHGESFRDADEHRSNRINQQLTDLTSDLLAEWPTPKKGLLNMLESKHDIVRLWAAIALRPHLATKSMEVLAELRNKPALIGLAARFHLESNDS